MSRTRGCGVLDCCGMVKQAYAPAGMGLDEEGGAWTLRPNAAEAGDMAWKRETGLAKMELKLGTAKNWFVAGT